MQAVADGRDRNDFDISQGLITIHQMLNICNIASILELTRSRQADSKCEQLKFEHN